ncbi:MAG: triose-phosphate isomerase [Candidatus Eisenbacteria bacterium]|uniref:Triosephosphate isomerase n=1 Tax=Eiseniibacteriota bacterium TaxID=2212470 RepID=A0A937XCI4_UNCEI|nr:triose-phosphate isomerase [Candidatus Eisenbacteria bacterium]
MRPLLIAGNWKMHFGRAEGLALVDALLAEAASVPAERELLVLPPFTLLAPLAERLRGTRLRLGAQDLHWEAKGAYTGGVSGPMLRDAGCDYVLVGHSERRLHFGDRGEALARKLRAALNSGLRPIYCLGESLAEREEGRTGQVLAGQFDEGLAGLEAAAMRGVTLAYEPVWAIGTGRTATPETAQQAHAGLRARLAAAFGETIARETRILYGGSVKAENAAALLQGPDLDGALVGGASLSAEAFLGIARAPRGAA